MPVIRLSTAGDVHPWTDLEAKRAAGKLVHLANDAAPIGIARLTGGVASGKSSIMMRLDLPDGKVVLVETTMDLFLTVADAMRAAEERDGLR